MKADAVLFGHEHLAPERESGKPKYPCSESPHGVCEFMPIYYAGPIFRNYVCKWCLKETYK